MWLVIKVDCHSSQPRLCDKAWIYLLKPYKKPYRFAGKSILCKNAFPQSWEVRLQPLHLEEEAAAGCRLRLGPSLRPPPELVGQK
jgi:hypothetical protein